MILTDLKNQHSPVLPCTPNIYWDEMLQNNMTIEGYEDKDFNVVDEPAVMYCICKQALMMQEFRNHHGSVINSSGYRPELYNDVVLIEHGYKSEKDSDHKYNNSGAWDCTNVKPSDWNIKKWQEICNNYGVSWSIGLYSWGTHLGWRKNKPVRMWDNR